MGTPIPTPDPTYGSDCHFCTPPTGSRWPSGKTPYYVYVYFSGIDKCAATPTTPPNGHTFTLHQHDTNFCMWQHLGDVFKCYFYAYRPSDGKSFIRLEDDLARPFFRQTGPACPPEFERYENMQNWCVGQYAGKNGIAIVHWSEETLWLVSQLGLEAGDTLFQELRSGPQNDVVQKFCDRNQRTNIKIRTEH